MPKRYWYIIITYIVAQLFPIIGAPLAIALLNLSEGDSIVYSYIFGMTIGTIITIRLLRPDMEQSQMRDRPGNSYIFKWAVIGFFLAFLSQYIANLINIEVLGLKRSSENTQDIMAMIDENILFIIIPILFAPLLEEIIFRKIIFGQLYKKMNFYFAAIISSAIFSVLHFDIPFILTYIAMGLVFAYLYVKTKRIIVPILVHMAMNTTVVLIQLNVDVDELERKLEEMENAAMIIIGG